MRDALSWLLFAFIDVFKVLIVFTVIFGIFSAMGAMYAKNFIFIIYKGAIMKTFLKVCGVIAILIFLAVYFFVKPAFEALQGFHFG